MAESAWTHIRIMSKKQSISQALKNPNISEDWKKKLQLSQDIRPYIKKLGLKITKNYQSFVNLNQDYISYLVVVAPSYSVQPKKWGFPFIGSFPYKGFYTQPKALKFAKKYKNKGLDTYTRGVTAYSTLGWFKDPLLSTMMRFTESDLIETIIHESIHATIFIPNNVSFNEQLSVFISQKATLEYYKNQNDSHSTYSTVLQKYSDEDIFRKFLNEETLALKHFYRKIDNHNPKSKKHFFVQVKQKFKKQIQPQLKKNKYTFFNSIKLNNAFFAAQSTYNNNQDLFEKEFQKHPDIASFISYLKTIPPEDIQKKFVTPQPL